MSPLKKQPPPYGLMVTGLVLIILSAMFMVLHGGVSGRPFVFLSEGQRGMIGIGAYDSSVSQEPMMGGGTSGKMMPIVPMPGRGVPAGVDRKITKNASLELVVEQAEAAIESISLMADSYEGFVVESQLYERGAAKTGTILIRVPSSSFQEVLDNLKTLALEVRSETIRADDVTEQYVDLEARLENLEAQETRYLAILRTAKTVEDTLKVTQYLNQVRAEIDQITGQLEYLKNRINMSSVSITLLAEEDIEVFGIRWQPLLILKESFRAMLQGIAGYVDAIIALFFYIPVLLLWGATIFVVFYAGWKIIGKAKN